MRSAIVGLVILLGLVLLPTSASGAECTDTWKGPAEGTWSTASNWSTGKVPTSSDIVCVGVGKTVKVTTNAAAAGAQVDGTLSVAGVTLELTGPSVIANLVASLSNAVLTGSGTVTVTESLNWGATMKGTGSTVLASGATATGWKLLERTFVNEGTVNFNLGYLTIKNGALFENIGIFNANSEGGRLSSENTAATFLNLGTFRKITGTGATEVAIPFVNDGTVEAQTGSLEFWSGATSPNADWLAAKGAQLVFTGGLFKLVGGRLEGSLKVTKQATVKLEEGVEPIGLSLVIAGYRNSFQAYVSIVEVLQEELRLKSLSLYPGGIGILTGPGTVTVAESLEWGGLMSGTGSTVLLPGATATADSNILSERTFVNEGTFSLNADYMTMREGSLFRNAGDFIANTQTGSGLGTGGSTAEFLNLGTFEKTTGTGKTIVSVPFANGGTGTIKELSGHLEIKNKVAVKSSANTPHRSECGDPVDCATGNFTETQTDFRIGGRGVGLDLNRTYGAQAAAAGSVGMFGYGWSNSFGATLTAEESGAKETLTDASGATTTFTRSGASWVAPSWSRSLLAGSAESGFTLTQPGQTKEKFDASGRLESVTDNNGNETSLAYNGSGKLETIIDPSGRKITLTYNGEGLVEKAKDPMGHEIKYAYESKNLKSVTLPGEASPSWQFKYDGSHRMTSFTDGRGGKTTNEYDSSSRVISQTDPAERKTTWEYAPFHTKIANKATGAVTDEWFNSNNQPMSIIRGFGTVVASTESFTYAPAGLLASKTDGNGHTTTYGYDNEGNRTSERDAEGDETKWTYNEAHQVLSETNPNGEKTTIVRNANGNPETISRPAPESKTQTVSYEYGPHGEVKSMTDPLGHAWSYEYDGNGDLQAEIDPEGDKRTWAFNEDSQVTSTVSPRGNEEGAEAAKFTTTVERDSQGRPIKITNPLGGTTKRTYDADGNVESITDPNGRKTKFTYDADNERTKVELPNGTVEETGYDGAGKVTSQVDGKKDKTTYVRNVLEQPIEIIDPLERNTVQTFDAAGNLKTKTDPDGRTTTFAYDKADRLKEIAYSAEAGQDVTFGYNEDGNLTSMVDGTGESAWEYDQLGRLVHSKSGHGETVAWEYNLADEPVGLTYPNGKSISRAYDKVGRLESVTDWLGHTTSFGYNKDSAPTLTTFPVGTTDTDEYAWDSADRMASVTMKKGAETLASLAYSRDPAGQLESLISKGLPGAETESFSYDENERLTKAGSAEFGYDAADNITKAPGTTNAFDKASQIESATGAAFTFDKEGERTKRTPASGPATTYKYSQAGDLTAIERPEEGETAAISESFGYDGNGLMASRTVGLSTTHFIWDLSRSPGLLLSDGADSYLYGPGGMPFEQISSGEEPTYLHHDQLGSTRLLTKPPGNPSRRSRTRLTAGSPGTPGPRRRRWATPGSTRSGRAACNTCEPGSTTRRRRSS